MDEDYNKLIEVIRNQKFALLGNIAKKFEKEFAKFNDVKYVIPVNSGIAARYLAIASLELKHDDEVIIPPFTSVATANSILQNNGKPIFVDINNKSFTIDPESIKEKITNKTKAIIPIHLAGVPSEMDQIIEIARDNNITLIEDISQSFGSKYKGKKVGSIGDIGAFTFYPSDVLNVSEGGVITTNNKALAEKIRILVQHGEDNNYIYNRLGWNYRMTGLQAGICRIQLKQSESIIKLKNKNAEYLTEAVENINGIDPQYVPEYSEPAFSYWIGRIRSDIIGINRNQFMDLFSKDKIFHPKLLYTTKLFQENIDYSTLRLPIAEKLSQEIFAFDIYPDISIKEMAENINIIKKIVAKYK